MGFSLCLLVRSKLGLYLILTKKSKAGSNKHENAKRINDVIKKR